MVTKTLIGLACLITSRGPFEVAPLIESLSQQELTELAAIVDSDICLPDAFEAKLVETSFKVERGELPKPNPLAGPAEASFVDPK